MTYQDIKNALAAAGIDVRLPGAKPGICKEPYVVVQENGTYPYAAFYRLGYTLITVHCYVPLQRYTDLEALVSRVKAALVPLSPDLRPTGNRGIDSINDTFKAHESSVEYMIQKRL